MNVFSLGPFYRVLSLIKGLFSFILRIMFTRKKKLEGNVDDDGNPIEIISVGAEDPSKCGQEQAYGNFGFKGNNQGYNNEVSENHTLTDWSDWKDNNQEEVPESAMDNVNLFEDMEPKLTRPRMLKVVTKSTKEQRNNRLQVDGTNFEVQSELGTWVDNSSGWDEEVLDDLSEEAANILKEKRKMERQRRTIEQKKKKEELRANRAEKKNASQLGMKVN